MQEREQVNRAKLEEQLRARDIPLETWGKGAAKTIEHLVEELHKGESELYFTDDEIIRAFDAVGVIVWHVTADGQRRLMLREDRQEFKDGRIRRRDLYPSLAEKMKLGELPEDAAKRALQEELGLTGNFLFSPHETKRVAGLSGSFPGLKILYNAFIFTVGISSEDYQAEGYKEEQEDKTTYFVWKDF